MTLPTHGNIVRLVDAKKEKKEWFVGIGEGLDWVMLDAYSREIEKLCCVRCSEREDCELQDGSCWEDE